MSIPYCVGLLPSLVVRVQHRIEEARLEQANQLRKRRIERLFSNPSGNAVVVALDDVALSPNGSITDLGPLFERAVESNVDGILGFPGLFDRRTQSEGVTRIVNVTHSSSGPLHLIKNQVFPIEALGTIGADMVSCHVNMAQQRTEEGYPISQDLTQSTQMAEWQAQMIETLGTISAKSKKLGLPLLVHMYPRTLIDGTENHYEELRKTNPELFSEMVAFAAKVGSSMGADVLKLPWTGSIETMQAVVKCADGVPVLVAGGPKQEPIEYLTVVHEALKAGAKGVAVGRNFFESPTTLQTQMGTAISLVVHERQSPQAALELATQSRKTAISIS